MGLRLLKIAVVYLVVGALLGLAMGISQNFALTPVHAHLLLLGWGSLALAGVIHRLCPTVYATRLARLRFWLHSAGPTAVMAGLALLLAGREWAMPLTVAGAVTALAGLLLFAVNVLVHAHEPGGSPR